MKPSPLVFFPLLFLAVAASSPPPPPPSLRCKAWLVQSIPTDMPHLPRVPGVLSTGEFETLILLAFAWVSYLYCALEPLQGTCCAGWRATPRRVWTWSHSTGSFWRSRTTPNRGITDSRRRIWRSSAQVKGVRSTSLWRMLPIERLTSGKHPKTQFSSVWRHCTCFLAFHLLLGRHWHFVPYKSSPRLLCSRQRNPNIRDQVLAMPIASPVGFVLPSFPSGKKPFCALYKFSKSSLLSLEKP